MTQGGGREGYCINNISDESKQKVIALIISKINNYEPYRAKRALLIVDWLRRGKILCKAYISPSEVSREFDENKWWLESGLAEVKSKYRSWWNMNLDWQEKKQVDPLAQTNIRIKENCG